ncbi:MAG: histidine phosphatase family protein [Patescibacteria group bacterium]
MKQVYLVRHGESQSNAGGIVIGAEAPLTPRGVEQAKFIAERISKLPVEAIVSSTMLRALQTAQYISDVKNIRVETSDLFCERINPQEQFGLTNTDPEYNRIEDLVNIRYGDEGYRFSNEDTYADLNVRAQKALFYLEERTEEHIAVVTHSVFVRALLATLLFGKNISGHESKKIFRGFKTANTGLTIFQHDTNNQLGHWRVVVWNDHAHLAD